MTTIETDVERWVESLSREHLKFLRDLLGRVGAVQLGRLLRDAVSCELELRNDARIAQRTERRTSTPEVAGSNPVAGTELSW